MTSNAEIPKMQYVRFGNTGLKVSRLCLGCMSYGSSKWQPWVKDEAESIKLIKEAYEAGINFFDTADTYSNGESERVLGKALKELNAPRSRVVVATKVWGPVYENGGMDIQTLRENTDLINRWGVSRKHIFDACEASLERLGLDYIDLYQIHRLDDDTPLEEIMCALNDLVRSGKVRYIGASTMKAWEFQKMNNIAEKNGWAKFVSMQNCYNLLYREEEREMIPYSIDTGIAGIPWSPLAMGELTGKNRNTARTNSSLNMKNFFPADRENSKNQIVDRCIELGEKKGVTAAQIALAWCYSKPFVTSPIIGCSKIENLYDLMGAMSLELSEEEVKYLEEPYITSDPMPTRF